MHVITQDGVLWRTLPCPIPPGQRHRLQGVRLAGPAPLPPAAITVQRRVSSRGGIQVARQRIQVGMTHAGKTVTVISEDDNFRLVIDGETVARRAPHHQPGDPPLQGLRDRNRPLTRPAPKEVNPMPDLRLDAVDAVELAELLQFLAGWLARDPDRLGASLEDFVGHPAYGTGAAAPGPAPVHLPARRRRRRVPVRPRHGRSGPVTVTSPLRGPKSSEGGGFAAAHLRARRAGYGAAPPASRVLRIALRATALRAALDPGDHCGPWDREERGRPRPAPALRAARKPRGGGRVQAPELEGHR